MEAPEPAKQHLWAEFMVRDCQAGRGTANEREWTRLGSFHREGREGNEGSKCMVVVQAGRRTHRPRRPCAAGAESFAAGAKGEERSIARGAVVPALLALPFDCLASTVSDLCAPAGKPCSCPLNYPLANSSLSTLLLRVAPKAISLKRRSPRSNVCDPKHSRLLRCRAPPSRAMISNAVPISSTSVFF
jgi:hypothetical protein